MAATPGDPQARCIRAGLAIVDAAMDPGSSGPEVVIVPRVGIDTGLVPTQGETAGQLLIGIGRMLAQVDALIESARQVEARTPPRSVCVRESTVLSVRGQFEFERLDAQAESSAPPTWLVRGEAESRTPTTEIVATEPAQPTEEVPTTRSPEIDRAGPPHVGLARKRRGVAVYALVAVAVSAVVAVVLFSALNRNGPSTGGTGSPSSAIPVIKDAAWLQYRGGA
ncbi:MAG TPA: hypothetical protein VEM93_05500, partial [Actinomycetota bacterium]|nr:hypothetical protein [Actinomycetota bacterium]